MNGPSKLVWLFLSLLLAACSSVITPTPETVIPKASVGNKLPMRVVLLIPQTSDVSPTYQEMHTPCAPTYDIKTFKFGEVFEADLVPAFSTVFENATIVRSFEDAKQADAIFVPSLTALITRVGCPLSPEEYWVADGALESRSVDGGTVWHASTTSKRLDINIDDELHDIRNVPWEVVVGRELSNVMAALIDAWIKELRNTDVLLFAAVPKPIVDIALTTGAEAEGHGDLKGALTIYTGALQKYGVGAGLNDVVNHAIDVSLRLRPHPTMPEDAIKHATFAETALKTAKTQEDFGVARREYQSALAAAPWWADAWVNLALVDEQLSDFKGAHDALGHYLRAAPDATDRATVQQKMYEYEFKATQQKN